MNASPLGYLFIGSLGYNRPFYPFTLRHLVLPDDWWAWNNIAWQFLRLVFEIDPKFDLRSIQHTRVTLSLFFMRHFKHATTREFSRGEFVRQSKTLLWLQHNLHRIKRVHYFCCEPIQTNNRRGHEQNVPNISWREELGVVTRGMLRRLTSHFKDRRHPVWPIGPTLRLLSAAPLAHLVSTSSANL